MDKTLENSEEVLTIDYYHLMDLRIDYAFKVLFTKGTPRLLISLLNAIFANKKINRVIKSGSSPQSVKKAFGEHCQRRRSA